MGELTQLLEAARAGEPGAVDQVISFTYRELKVLAHQRLQRRLAQRRGGGVTHITVGQMPDSAARDEDEVVRVDEALRGLRKIDERLAQVVELKYFGGLSGEEIAAVLNVTERTVRRDWES
jgi:DNA-directed RNA polymerase specialized sigma24 family protein